MEIFLLLVLVGFLFVIKSNFNSRFDYLQDRFDDLNKKIESLKSGDFLVEVKKPVEKPIEKVDLPPIPDVVKTIPKLAAENPPIAIPVIKPVVEEKKEEAVVFTMDSYSDAKPEPKKSYSTVPDKKP